MRPQRLAVAQHEVEGAVPRPRAAAARRRVRAQLGDRSARRRAPWPAPASASRRRARCRCRRPGGTRRAAAARSPSGRRCARTPSSGPTARARTGACSRSATRPCVALRMWAMMLLALDRVAAHHLGHRRAAARCWCVDEQAHAVALEEGDAEAVLVLLGAACAKPVKLNITSVGVLAFMPSSWHIAIALGCSESASAPVEEPAATSQRSAVAVAGFVEHASSCGAAMRWLLRARQISRSASHGWRLTWLACAYSSKRGLQRGRPGVGSRARTVGVCRRRRRRLRSPRRHGSAGLQRLADAFAGERIGAARGLAGHDQHAGSRTSRALERAAQRRALQRRPAGQPSPPCDQLARRRVERHGTSSKTSRRLSSRLSAWPRLRAAWLVGDADADVEQAVAAREDPAVAGRQRAVPDDLERCRCAPTIARVAARSRAARRRSARGARDMPAASSACGTRAGGEHAASARGSCARAPPCCELGADDARRPRRSGATKRSGANIRAPAATAARQTIRRAPCAAAPRACRARRCARRAGRCSRASAARPRLRPSRRRARRGARRALCGVGIRPSPQTLSRGKACWSTSTHVAAGARQRRCAARAAGRAGADDEHVAARREAVDAEVHRVRSGSARWPAAGPDPSGAAATTAQAVIAPTSAKVSW